MNTHTHTRTLIKLINEKYLVNIFSLVFFLVNASAFGQGGAPGYSKNTSPAPKQVEISIVKNSDAPNTSPEQIYLLKAENTTGKALSFSIGAKNINCSGKVNTKMDAHVYWAGSGTGIFSDVSERRTIPAHSSVEFYVKLNRPENTLLNTWNCMEVKVADGDALNSNNGVFINNIQSNGIVIETFIPDPKDFR